MKIVVGLGNPGDKYTNTRHNVGFYVVDKYLGDQIYKEKFNSLYIKKNIEGNDVLFIKPLTYMNLSGDTVKKYVNYFNINIDDVLIIQDDLDMLIGTYKLKKFTSSGGHNGIKSIEENLKTKNFARLKIGILNETKKDVINFVLGKMTREEQEKIKEIDTNKIINLFITEGFNDALNKYKG